VSASAGLGAVVAGCGSHKSSVQLTTTTSRTPGPDVPLLNHLLDLEHMTIAAYTASIPLLSGAAHLAGRRFLIQELSHAGELGGLVRQAGGKASHPKASYPLGHPNSEIDVLWGLHHVEQRELAAQLDALPRLSTPAVRSAVASILANDAQHLSILRLTLGRNPVPSAFAGPLE
jgi:hypothetical protein